MYKTEHIDFTFGHTPGENPVLFPQNNVVISFKTRGAAEAAIKEANMSAHSAIRLYDSGDKHGS